MLKLVRIYNSRYNQISILLSSTYHTIIFYFHFSNALLNLITFKMYLRAEVSIIEVNINIP